MTTITADRDEDTELNLSDLIDKLSTLIRNARKEAKLTQKDLATEADISQEYVSMIETGRRVPEYEVLKKIADALSNTGITYQELYILAETISLWHAFGATIRRARKTLRFNKKAFARKIGLQQESLSMIESGNEIPDDATLKKIAFVLRNAGLTYQELCFRLESIRDPERTLHIDKVGESIVHEFKNIIKNPHLFKALLKLENLVDKGFFHENDVNDIAERFILEIDFRLPSKVEKRTIVTIQ